MEQPQNPQEIAIATAAKSPWQAPTLIAMPVPEFTATADLGATDGITAVS